MEVCLGILRPVREHIPISRPLSLSTAVLTHERSVTVNVCLFERGKTFEEDDTGMECVETLESWVVVRSVFDP